MRFIRPMRVWLGDEEITHMVVGVSIEEETEEVDIGMFTETRPTGMRDLHLELADNVDTFSNTTGTVGVVQVTPPVSGYRPGSYTYTYEEHTDFNRATIRRGTQTRPEPVDLGVESRRVGTHVFVQNPDDLPAKLCKNCGMWPDHHNHGAGRCVCQDCESDADELHGANDPLVSMDSQSTVRYRDEDQAIQSGTNPVEGGAPIPMPEDWQPDVERLREFNRQRQNTPSSFGVSGAVTEMAQDLFDLAFGGRAPTPCGDDMETTCNVCREYLRLLEEHYGTSGPFDD